MVAMFACIAGSNLLQSNVTGLVTIPSTIVCFLFISFFATRLGQRKAMLIGSVGGLITNGILAALWLFGDPTTMTSNPETGALNWGLLPDHLSGLYHHHCWFPGVSPVTSLSP